MSNDSTLTKSDDFEIRKCDSNEIFVIIRPNVIQPNINIFN